MKFRAKRNEICSNKAVAIWSQPKFPRPVFRDVSVTATLGRRGFLVFWRRHSTPECRLQLNRKASDAGYHWYVMEKYIETTDTLKPMSQIIKPWILTEIDLFRKAPISAHVMFISFHILSLYILYMNEKPASSLYIWSVRTLVNNSEDDGYWRPVPVPFCCFCPCAVYTKLCRNFLGFFNNNNFILNFILHSHFTLNLDLNRK
jgi:hypothetical protein